MATLDWLPDRGKWRVRWHATNRRTGETMTGSKCLGDKAAAAELWARRVAQEADFRSGRSGPIDQTLTALAEAFDTYCLRHSPTTRDLYHRSIRRFLSAIPAKTLQDLRPSHIEDYLGELARKGLENRTLNMYLTSIKSFCRFASKRFSAPNPAAEVPMLHEDPPTARFLSVEEYRVILESADPTNRDRLIFLANTGLRATEFSTLVASGRLVAGLAAVTLVGKGRKRRTVPLNAAARDTLLRPLIRRPCGRTGLLQAFHKIAKRASIPPFGTTSPRRCY